MGPKDLLTGTHFNFNSPPLYVLLTGWIKARKARAGLPQELQRLTEVKDRKTQKSDRVTKPLFSGKKPWLHRH